MKLELVIAEDDVRSYLVVLVAIGLFDRNAGEAIQRSATNLGQFFRG